MKHILSSGLVAGLAAGLLCALLQYLLVEPRILLAERYESGELVHFQGVVDGASGHDHSADGATVEAPANTAAAAPAEGVHDHHHGGGAATGEGQRHALTVLFAVLTYAGYGLILAGGMAFAAQQGLQLDAAEAMLWGLAGFMAFQLLPALGLPPELPGTPGADLSARQVWWSATAVSGLLGLGLLAYGRGWLMRAIGLAILAVPHVMGAPQAEGFGGIVPPELAAGFAARTLGVGLVTWVALALAVHTLWRGEAR